MTVFHHEVFWPRSLLRSLDFRAMSGSAFGSVTFTRQFSTADYSDVLDSGPDATAAPASRTSGHEGASVCSERFKDSNDSRLHSMSTDYLLSVLDHLGRMLSNSHRPTC